HRRDDDVEEAVAVEIGEHWRAEDAGLHVVRLCAERHRRERRIDAHREARRERAVVAEDVDVALDVRVDDLRVAVAVEVTDGGARGGGGRGRRDAPAREGGCTQMGGDVACHVGRHREARELRAVGVVGQLGSSSSLTRRRTVKANWFEGMFACPCTTGPEGGAEKSVPGGNAAMTSARFRLVRSAPGRRGGEVLSSKPTWPGLEPIANWVKLVGSMPIPNSSVQWSDVVAPRSAAAVPTIGTMSDSFTPSLPMSGSSTWNHAGRSRVASGGILAAMPSAG